MAESRLVRNKPVKNIILGCVLVLATPAVMGELIHLGDRQITCKKGALRLHGDRGSKRYPAGKREQIRVRRLTGILPYTCRYIRRIVTCPLGTIAMNVKRGVYPGKYEVECLADAKARLPEIAPQLSSDVDEAPSEPAPEP